MRKPAMFIALIASALMLPAVVQAADTEQAAQSAAETKPAAAEKQTEKAKAAKAEAALEAKCEYIPGSRIRRDPPADCDSGPSGVRSFSADELQSTGETNLAEALRKLDPRFR